MTNGATAEQFGRWLSVTMGNKGIVAKDLADEIGVNPSTLSRWMNGQATPGMDRCTALAIALDVDPARLAVTAGLMNAQVAEAANIKPLPIPPATARLEYLKKQIDGIRGASPELRKKLLEALNEAHNQGNT